MEPRDNDCSSFPDSRSSCTGRPNDNMRLIQECLFENARNNRLVDSGAPGHGLHKRHEITKLLAFWPAHTSPPQ